MGITGASTRRLQEKITSLELTQQKRGEEHQSAMHATGRSVSTCSILEPPSFEHTCSEGVEQERRHHVLPISGQAEFVCADPGLSPAIVQSYLGGRDGSQESDPIPPEVLESFSAVQCKR